MIINYFHLLLLFFLLFPFLCLYFLLFLLFIISFRIYKNLFGLPCFFSFFSHHCISNNFSFQNFFSKSSISIFFLHIYFFFRQITPELIFSCQNLTVLPPFQKFAVIVALTECSSCHNAIIFASMHLIWDTSEKT